MSSSSFPSLLIYCGGLKLLLVFGGVNNPDCTVGISPSFALTPLSTHHHVRYLTNQTLLVRRLVLPIILDTSFSYAEAKYTYMSIYLYYVLDVY